MPFVVIDTDIASLIQKGRLPTAYGRVLLGARLCVSFVTVGELTTWAELRSWSERTQARLDRWLSSVIVLHSSERICHTWGRLAAANQRRGRPRPTNDMWIAACCIALGLPLLTRNVRDFADFAEHDGLQLIQP